MKTIKLKKYQHLIKAGSVIPFQIGNLYRCLTYLKTDNGFEPALWTVTHKSIYRATYMPDDRLHLVNQKTGGYLFSPIKPINFGLWMISPRERNHPELTYIIEPV